MTVRPWFPSIILYQAHRPHTISQYSYLTCIPLIAIYAVGFSIIKYSYGFTVIPGMGSEWAQSATLTSSADAKFSKVTPTPYELWNDGARNAILPLYLCFSVAWGLEMWVCPTDIRWHGLMFWLRVTHLEGLFFAPWHLSWDWICAPQSYAFGFSSFALILPNKIGSAAYISKHGRSDL